MIIYVLIAFAELCLIAALLYTIYKLIWYTVKLIIFYIRLGRIKSHGADVKWLRPRLAFVFGKKGIADLEIKLQSSIFLIREIDLRDILF